MISYQVFKSLIYNDDNDDDNDNRWMYRFALRIRFAWTQMINYSIMTNWFDNLEERWIFLVKLAAIFITTLWAFYIDPQLSTQVSWNLHLISWDLGVPMVLNVSHWHFYFFFGFSYDANGPMDGMSFGQTLHLHAPLQGFVVYSLMLYLNAHALESRHTHTHTQKKKTLICFRHTKNSPLWLVYCP